MKAKELKDKLGPLAYLIAKKAGYSRSYWDHLVSTGKGIAKTRIAPLIDAIDEAVVLLESVKKELQSNK